MEANNQQSTARELTFFGALAAVLLVVILVIIIIRPWIFGSVVPAIFGLNQPEPISEPLVIPEENEEPAVDDEMDDASDDEDMSDDEIVDDEALPPATEPPPGPTAVPTLQHTVAAGETLTSIAARYGVSIDILVEINQLENADRITPGDVLLIPASN